ncbi:MAG TPA: FecR family protein [Spirochaetota bacterium]|nr:FecR family protein [Spirochaetota bacterium]HPV43144.1 FecR family protein [Spirochaetota bacterium]
MKPQAVTRVTSLYMSIALVLTGAFFSSCIQKEANEKKPVRAMATFVIGTVTLERAGEPARKLRHKEELAHGDVVRTGPDSLLVVQIGDDSVIKIEAGTTVSMGLFLERGNSQFYIDQGRMFSRVRHLSKDSTFRVYTKTSLAAVRGTEFSVTSRKDESVVAVNDGSVAVRTVAEGKETNEEQTVENGKTAEVKGSIKTRPVNAEEKKEFNRFARITPIENLDSTSEEDLRRMEVDYQENKDKAVVIDKDGDHKDKKDKDREKKDDKASDQEKPAENDAAKQTVLWTSKSVYGTADPIIVYYKNMPEYRNCWIDISKAADGDGRYQSYQWTYSAKNGQMTFSGMNLAPGTYEVRAHFGRSGSVDKRYRFQVR